MTGKKQFTKVKCRDCQKEYLKRKDTLKNWNNFCQKCSTKVVAQTPKMKKFYHQNGLNFIAKFGKLAAPKMENRPRGETHWHWRLSIKGKDAPNWRGGLTIQNELERHCLEYRLWREAVFKRDNFTCTGCDDKRGGNLNADHIKPWALYPELRYAIDNEQQQMQTIFEYN